MKKNLYYIITAIFLVLIVVADICYITVAASPYVTKTIASSLFVLCGVFNLIYCIKKHNEFNKVYKYLMMAGLVFGALGDIFLIDNFIIGAALFAIGHIFYVVAYFFISKFTWKDIVSCLTVTGFSLIVIFCFEFNFNGMLPLVIAYAVVISLMLGKAFSIIFDKNFTLPIKLIIAIGSFLFFFSDMMLLFNVFGVPSRIYGILCLATYYPAQFLLATSIYFISRHKKEIKNKQ